jgi:hypothetical protein
MKKVIVAQMQPRAGQAEDCGGSLSPTSIAAAGSSRRPSAEPVVAIGPMNYGAGITVWDMADHLAKKRGLDVA